MLLARSFSACLSPVWRKTCRVFLALFWVAGLLCGICVCLLGRSSVSSLMRGAASGAMSIVGLYLVTFFPFLVSAFAVIISWPGLLLPIGFFRAFSYAFTALGITVCYGQAGWLAHILLMFSQWAAMPFLYFFWTRHISGERKLYGWELIASALLCIGLGSIEYWFLSPLMGRLVA